MKASRVCVRGCNQESASSSGASPIAAVLCGAVAGAVRPPGPVALGLVLCGSWCSAVQCQGCVVHRSQLQ